MATDAQQRRRLALIVIAVGHRSADQRPGDALPQRLAWLVNLLIDKAIQFIIRGCRRRIVQRAQPQLRGRNLLLFAEQNRVM